MRHLLFPTTGKEFREDEPGAEAGGSEGEGSAPREPQGSGGERRPRGEEPGGEPEGVYVERGDWNRTQAELRKLKREKREREQEAEERRQQEELDQAKAAGEFDKALGLQRDRADRAERQLKERNVRDAISQEAAARNFTAEQAAALARLTSIGSIELDDVGEPRADQVADAVEGTIGRYPNLFKASDAQAGDGEGRTRQPRRRQAGPATPPGDQGAPFDGYVSPEEYQATPRSTRMGAEFQKRVEKSRPFWPDKVPASSFAVGG